jgi:hypothetical protein
MAVWLSIFSLFVEGGEWHGKPNTMKSKTEMLKKKEIHKYRRCVLKTKPPFQKTEESHVD